MFGKLSSDLGDLIFSSTLLYLDAKRDPRAFEYPQILTGSIYCFTTY